jgi:hypothetical protein
MRGKKWRWLRVGDYDLRIVGALEHAAPAEEARRSVDFPIRGARGYPCVFFFFLLFFFSFSNHGIRCFSFHSLSERLPMNEKALICPIFLNTFMLLFLTCVLYPCGNLGVRFAVTPTEATGE